MQPAGTDFFIYGEPDNINFFVTTPLAPVSEEGAETRQASVSAHTRRRYAGDTNPINVSGSQREYLYDPGRKVGNALPGNSFILSGGGEKRQFTLQGEIVDLHAYLVGEASIALRLHTGRGASYPIAAASAEGG